MVDGDDVVVLDPRNGAGLAQETFAGGRVARQLGVQGFQGHAPTQLHVLGLEDQPHAAGAKEPEEAVVAEPPQFAVLSRREGIESAWIDHNGPLARDEELQSLGEFPNVPVRLALG